MIRRRIARLARMDLAELSSRGLTAARTMFDRAGTRVAPPRWQRTDLLRALAPLGELTAVRGALSNQRWDEAQRVLARHFMDAPPRFVICAASKERQSASVRRQFPRAECDAAARADRVLAGHYDLLGYRGLRFDSPPGSTPTPDLRHRDSDTGARGTARPPSLAGAAIDWHLDPVHQRRAPRLFWSTVPYLDPACGDHKVIWELNRHQHWLVLGRAFWLTGNRKYRGRVLAELASWLDANPPLVGVNWASMLEIAFRSLSWLWAINFFVEDDEGPPWLVDLLIALDRQLTHVERNLSRYFSPNTHLLGEALALYVAGRALPELAASPRREKTGRGILLAEIDRQICPDGGHRERSTHYHRYALDFYSLALAVARITGDDASGRFEDAVARLGCAARLLADDSGRLPHFGDDDGGSLLPIAGREPDDVRDSLAIAATLADRPDLRIGAAPEEAIWMLDGHPSTIRGAQSSIGVSPARSSALRQMGYFVSRSTAGDHLVIDGGPHGYQNGGHAHADALSMTFAVRGLPLLIDPGTACYTSNPELRNRMRSTALHNTLTLDDRPQSVPRGPFHWSQVANSRVHAWRTNDRFDFFDGAHDGYRPIEHRRRVLALHGDLVVIADLVSSMCAPAMHTAAVHWHLDPRWTADVRGRRAVLVHADNKNLRVNLVVPQGLVDHFVADGETGLGWHSPVYGRLERTTTVRVSQSGTAPFWMISVFDLDPENPVADVEWVPVAAEAGAIAHAAAISITRAASVDHVLFAAPADEDQTAEIAEKEFSSVCSASSAVKRHGVWRAGELETDARMLFWRTTASRPVARLGLVDGSIVRVAGGSFQLALPGIVSTFSADYGTADQARTTHQSAGTKDQEACAASPVS